ncbi:MAG: hypothetical protein D6719_01580 [Candidatus Dadabacteria bacterium]|nr:MAG: hypothetical protein D6719_01580 [Candidatus Dadabacteria bacterium]
MVDITTGNNGGPEQENPGTNPDGKEPGIEIVETDDHPDSVAVHLGRAVAGAAIEDHFLDVVVPTIARAIHRQRDRLLEETDRVIGQKLERDISEVVRPILKDVVQEAVHEAMDLGEPGMVVEIHDRAMERVRYFSRQHMLFPVLLRLLSIKDRNNRPLNIALNGPAGNGKTSMALNAAEALGIEAVLQPFNPQTTKSDLLGYMDASGRYVPSPFYKAFTEGRVFIADEFDAANPAIAITLNSAVANGVLTFPNGETVRAHPNFRAVFIMNTLGTGANHQYTGRMRQDAATLDRLVQLHVPIDQGLEASIAGLAAGEMNKIDIEEGGHFKDNQEILDTVRAIRQAAAELELKYIISPRAVLHATAMHAGGFGKKWIMECCVWRGMPEHERAAIAKRARIEP